MARPRVTDGEHGFRLWRVAVAVADSRKGELGEEIKTPHLKKNSLLRSVTGGLGNGGL
jgi:hypothetical protein